MLEVSGLTKRFGGLLAVNEASLSVAEGEIVGLIGPNGAGKTTLFAMISGFHAPDAGSVTFAGESIIGLSPHRLAERGLTRTFQIVQPFAGVTVRENIAVGAHLHHRGRREALQAAEAVAERVGMGSMLDNPADSLTVAGRKRLEVAKALATQPRLLLFDEVLAGLNPSEIRDILPLIRSIRDDGVTIFMIEHVMQAVMSLCDRAYVLNNGAIIASGDTTSVASDPAVIEAYLGHGAAQRLQRQAGVGQAGAAHA